MVDAHIHRGPMPNQYVSDNSLNALLTLMDRMDIDISISCNTRSLLLEDFAGGAQSASDEYRISRGRIKSLWYYHPRYEEECLRVMRAYRQDPAFCGVKIHPAWCYTNADDEAYRPIWEYAAEQEITILSHSWDISSYNPKQKYSFPSLFEKYVAEYPSVNVVLAHSGGRYRGILAAVELGKQYKNVYFDTAGDIWPNGFMEFLAENVGADHILYGSDYTMMDQRVMLGVVLGANISVRDKEAILCHTAKKVYRLKD